VSLSFIRMCKEMEWAIKAQLGQLSPSEEGKALVNGLVPALEAQTSMLVFSHLPEEQLSIHEKQLLALKCVKVFLQAFALTTGFPGCHHQEEQSGISHFLNIISISPLENILTSSDLLPPWMDEILSCQKIVKPFLTEISFNPQGSKGLTYKIKKEGKTRGYLFGTMHYLVTPEMRKAGDLAGIIFKRLTKCAVIGTEVVVRRKTRHDSVESRLMEVANLRGIANFGIDTAERKELENKKIEDSKFSDSEIIEYVARLVQSYIGGDVTQLKQLICNTPRDLSIEQKRDAQMANNIDLFLKTADVLGETRKETPFRSFFAIGAAHLLREESIPSLLAEKGWTLQLA